jgi:16S rRNA (guanine527-N7)-methyltransferase
VKARIQDLCQALDLQATAGQISAAAGFLELLSRWNGVYNLTSVREPDAMFTQHLADCLAIVPSLVAHGVAGRVLDVGSGGGLPGVVMALFMPSLQVTCIDAVGKKSAFVRQVAGTLKLPNLFSIHGRVEALRGPQFDVVTSRAFATLDKFVHLTRAPLRPGGCWVAMKGRVPDEELQALPDSIDVFHVERLTVPDLDAQRCLVWMREKVDASANPAAPAG